MRHASKTTTDLNRPAVLVVIEALEKSFTCEN
jgi:hypothetical protein